MRSCSLAVAIQACEFLLGGCVQVEAGLSDLRQAYAELHEELESNQKQKPPEEQQAIRQHVSLHSLIAVVLLVARDLENAAAVPFSLL